MSPFIARSSGAQFLFKRSLYSKKLAHWHEPRFTAQTEDVVGELEPLTRSDLE